MLLPDCQPAARDFACNTAAVFGAAAADTAAFAVPGRSAAAYCRIAPDSRRGSGRSNRRTARCVHSSDRSLRSADLWVPDGHPALQADPFLAAARPRRFRADQKKRSGRPARSRCDDRARRIPDTRQYRRVHRRGRRIQDI